MDTNHGGLFCQVKQFANTSADPGKLWYNTHAGKIEVT